MIATNGHVVPQGPAAAAWARMPFMKLKVEGDATLSHVRACSGSNPSDELSDELSDCVRLCLIASECV